MKRSTIFMLVAALSLGFLFVFPIWKITLEAPQYPGGISMYIWVNKITGKTEHTIQNINILNHYIGMKFIEPQSIPELTYFPYVVVGMLVLGIVVAFSQKPKLFLTWGVILLLLGILGIYDFYLWEYDYGHNLDPRAPIKVPGMVYQPPLFGSKMLLNFNASSYPSMGALFMGLAIVASFLAYYLGRPRPSQTSKGVSARKRVLAVNVMLSMISFSVFAGCSMEHQAINYGSDGCYHCKMTIVDQRYAAEIVTNTSKVYKFDAVECMLGTLQEGEFDKKQELMFWVSSFDQPGTFVKAQEAFFLRSPELPSPMGGFLTAFGDQQASKKAQTVHSGIVYTWPQLLEAFDKLPPLLNKPSND